MGLYPNFFVIGIAFCSALTFPAVAAEPCAAQCEQQGKCHSGSGGCEARYRADCEKSTLCQFAGACSCVDGACVAARDSDCKGSTRCENYHKECYARDGVCVADPKTPRNWRTPARADRADLAAMYAPKNETEVAAMRTDDGIAGRFTVVGDGTAFDNILRLQWQVSASKNSFVWQARARMSYCKTLHLAKRKDWRLPTIKELKSILNPDRPPDTPRVAPVFADSGWLWSGTPSCAGCSGWYAVVEEGFVDAEVLDNGGNSVRCVRAQTK